MSISRRLIVIQLSDMAGVAVVIGAIAFDKRVVSPIIECG